MRRQLRQPSAPSASTLERRRGADPSPGRPLEPAIRAQLEPRFGHDFGSVRVHDDDAAAASAGAMHARAYTIGSEIAFAAGDYAPGSVPGRELIAHELAHVVQQARGGTTPDAEARADLAAGEALRGGQVDAASLGGVGVGMQTKPDEPGKAEPDIITDAGGGAPEAAPAAAAPTATVVDSFARNKATLKKKQLDAIDQLAFSIWLHLSLYADAKAAIAISGHTDTTGSEALNLSLGAERAESARAALEAALQKQQVDPKRLSPVATKSLGKTQLRVPTADGVDAPGNRRVEIEVTIEVKPPPKAAPPAKPLPGMPGGPKVWEVPGIMDELDPVPGPPAPRVPTNKGEWLKDALERDPLLRKLPKWAREKAIGALKDADEKAVDAIIDAVPFDGEYKQAAKAAAKALLQTLKGRKFKPPPEPPRGIPEDMLRTPGFPKAPGEMIFKLPPIRF